MHYKFRNIHSIFTYDLTLAPSPWVTFYCISYCVLPSLLLFTVLTLGWCILLQLTSYLFLHAQLKYHFIRISAFLIRINQSFYCALTTKLYTSLYYSLLPAVDWGLLSNVRTGSQAP